ICAEQSQVAKVGRPAIDPVDDVVPVTPLRGMITTREGTSALPDNQRHGLAAGGDPSRTAQRQRHTVAVDDGGPNLGLIGNPQQLSGADLAAVAGLSDPSLGKQV